MIRRAPRQHRCVVMDVTGLEDPRLSLRAKGLLALILAKPDDARISGVALAKESADGRESHHAALKELEACGYLQRHRRQRPNGTWGWEQTMHEIPISAGRTEYGFTVFGETESGQAVFLSSSVVSSSVGSSGSVKAKAESSPTDYLADRGSAPGEAGSEQPPSQPRTQPLRRREGPNPTPNPTPTLAAKGRTEPNPEPLGEGKASSPSVNGFGSSPPDASCGPRSGKGTRNPARRPATALQALQARLVGVLGYGPSTSQEWGRWRRALADMFDAGATPEEVERRARELVRRWGFDRLTPTALATHWGALGVRPLGREEERDLRLREWAEARDREADADAERRGGGVGPDRSVLLAEDPVERPR